MRAWARASWVSLLLAVVVAGCLPASKKGGGEGAAARVGDGGVAVADGGQAAVEPLELVKWTGDYDAGWKRVEKLESEQKYEAAAKLVGEILERAREAGRVEDWLRGLIRTVQLRTALHGYERAVRFFRGQPWPEDVLGRTACELYYARLLLNYAASYRWEIQRRERVETKGEVDLKKWTLEQIYAEAGRAYGRLWRHRKQLGEQEAKELGKYLELGNYPRGIRGSLRDVLTYRWVELLLDRSGWRPEQKNEVYALGLEKLLGQEPGKPVELGDAGVHPLAKVALLLKDLESWHAAAGRREAALEARLELLRRLYGAFSQEQDRQKIERALRRRLAQERDLAWWAVGRAQLVQWVMGHADAGALVEARELAEDCERKYPESIGGRRCRSLREQIERPAYQLAGMASDGPGKRSLLVRHKNLERVWFRAYRMDLRALIESADDYNIFPQGRRIEKLLKGRAAVSWSVELAATPDYRMHKTFVVPPLKEPGYYLVVSSGREDFEPGDNRLMAVNLIVSDLVLVERQHGRRVVVTALSGSSGEPVRGAEVTLYQYNWRRGHRGVSTKVSGRDGTVEFERGDNRQYFLYARRGLQVALDPNYLYLYAYRPAERTTATLLYTDRSVYRPGQKLKFKAVVYEGRRSRGEYRTLSGRRVRVWLQDANGQNVADATYRTNEQGTVAGEFTIPAGRLLGQWQLRASPSGYAAVRVEEYKRPTFEVEVEEAKQALRLNRRARLTGRAKYYFGLPVSGGRVSWRVERRPQYPWWWGWWYGSAPAGSQVVATGSGRLSEGGEFTVEFTPRADERLADTGISYSYRLSVEVTDEGGETRTAERSYRLGFVAVEGRIWLEKGFLLAGRGEKLKVVRSNLDGAAAPGRGEWELYRLRQPERVLLPAERPQPRRPGQEEPQGYRTAGDGQRERWAANYSAAAELYGWADGERLAGGRLEHGKEGQAEITLPGLEPGAYRLRYRTKDAFGKEFTTQRELVVAGEGLKLQVPFYFALERGRVKVGERARLLVHSGIAGQVLVVERWRDGQLAERRLLRAGQDSGLIELPVTESERGGYGITVFAVRDHQLMQGQGGVTVPWDNHELELEFATFRDRLRPGQRESWTVKVRGPAGSDSAVAGAEVLGYMYDRSLDIFAPHNPPSVLSVYPSFLTVASLRANLYQARQSWLRSAGFKPASHYPALRPTRLAFLSGYGIGGVGYGGGGRFRHKAVALPAAAPAESARQSVTGKVVAADSTIRTLARRELDGVDKGVALDEARSGESQGVGGLGVESAPVELRQDFSETAFFQPQLLTGPDGTVELRFEVPDSVTSWNVWVHAVTRDMSGGSLKKEARTIKELMVRPYLPRFLREGDRAELKVVVQNAGESELGGELEFDIIDPETERSLLAEFGLTAERARRRFSVKPGGSSSEVFAVTAPVRVGQVAVRAVARAGKFSDGELRPLPLLPGRMHLMQSRFVTVKGGQRRRLHFADMERRDDASRIDERLVVTLDAQLFYSVLAAVPYLVNYPYECTEQLLNRFLSAGIMASLYARYPALQKLGRKLGERRTQYERFDRPDANRKLALEETPWLVQARGGEAAEAQLTKILVPEVARAHRQATLAKLRKAQTSSGGFPWFAGGPPSPYMTLYLLYGFSKGLEFGVEVPKDMVQRAWRYEKRHYVDHLVRECMAKDLCWETITFLNYVLSNYPDASWTGGVFSDADRKRMVDFSFKHWKQHAPLLKGYLALTLKRMGRGRDARLVWASVMDSAHTDADTGTSWAPEDRGWLWYNDSIETHALAVRVELELAPQDSKLEGLVQWLFLNKKLNHWKSTKATAEVVYSLAHYLKETGQLGKRQQARVKVGELVKEYTFEPDEYTGKSNQLVIAGERLDTQRQSTVEVENRSRGMMFASATWHFSTEKLPAEARGDLLQVRREYFRRIKTGREVVLRPLADGERIQVGDELEVHISLRAKHPAGYVHLRDPRPAGCEPVSLRSRHRWELGIYWYEEVRDSGTNFFFERLPQGEYPFKYRLRAAVAGTFKVAPATVQPMYAPEFAAYSAGREIVIQPAP